MYVTHHKLLPNSAFSTLRSFAESEEPCGGEMQEVCVDEQMEGMFPLPRLVCMFMLPLALHICSVHTFTVGTLGTRNTTQHGTHTSQPSSTTWFRPRPTCLPDPTVSVQSVTLSVTTASFDRMTYVFLGRASTSRPGTVQGLVFPLELHKAVFSET